MNAIFLVSITDPFGIIILNGVILRRDLKSCLSNAETISTYLLKYLARSVNRDFTVGVTFLCTQIYSENYPKDCKKVLKSNTNQLNTSKTTLILIKCKK